MVGACQAAAAPPQGREQASSTPSQRSPRAVGQRGEEQLPELGVSPFPGVCSSLTAITHRHVVTPSVTTACFQNYLFFIPLSPPDN